MKISKLDESNRTEAVRLLETSPAYNLFLLGNIAALGFSQDFCEFWGAFDDQERLRAILNRYMTGWSLFGESDADWRGLARVVDEHPLSSIRLQDNPGGTASLLPYLERYEVEDIHIEELMELDETDFREITSSSGPTVRRGVLADLPMLVGFFADAGHMSRSPEAVERPLRDTRVWLAEEDGAIQSVALTNAETINLAMIGGVYTPPQWRGRGLSQIVCSALSAELLVDAKRPVLYWDTPAAGAIYRKLGFRTVGEWRAVWLKRR